MACQILGPVCEKAVLLRSLSSCVCC